MSITATLASALLSAFGAGASAAGPDVGALETGANDEGLSPPPPHAARAAAAKAVNTARLKLLRCMNAISERSKKRTASWWPPFAFEPGHAMPSDVEWPHDPIRFGARCASTEIR
ncbi:hypothetical protein [Variovorax sp. RKNM96]|uniref:hypothetical protein n=1 Tax=Variovorax sp. RKNM96 TaxID=2681552 RepID=UPI001F123AB0|nr:hypothetical protein [Variovorax sp. RKNM96]